jgi:sensor histidine kinase YesM
MREKELQRQLQESRIAIMMSQIQPHFLYNVLNTIYHLCGKDDNTAKTVISDFSDYLRNNLDSLERKGLVPFSTEHNHVKTYLDIEKIRFGDELEIVYDIKAKDFFLPVMTIQPLVENAVKHGISKKRGGGRLTVSTVEKHDCYEIIVTDTGKGFDVQGYSYEKSHIGINNVRQRLKNTCGGTLNITSEYGKGTTAVVVIPKKENQI